MPLHPMTIHIGLTGGGNITQTHARAVRAIPGAEISAIYGTRSDRVRKLCEEFGGAAYESLDAFLSHRPLDMVILGSPSGVHAIEGIAAAARGLHVLTEKPVDVSTARVDALIAAAATAGVKLGVLFQDRVKPGIGKLKELVDGGAIGKPLFVEARVKWFRPEEYYANSQWRGTFALDGGGALMNQGVHTVDLLLWVLGEVKRVQARTATALHTIEAEDTVAVILEFASGTTGILHATTAAYPGYPRRVEISGTNGTVILEHDRLIAADLREARGAGIGASSGDANQSASTAVVSDFSGHQALIEDFIEAIRENRKPVCDGAEGRRSVALIEAIYRAAKDRCAVEI
ncbi:MAG TPA: Gfo/Idh/MocA family oxidoreductase [Candidatus Saccharimonadales bacterium]|nr:Gfo/Idh/MocA family oxidoreductase [Candidatus Saccharimonadales bacterium]